MAAAKPSFGSWNKALLAAGALGGLLIGFLIGSKLKPEE